MDLNLREISYFLKIAELGTLSGAAAVLSISQPALSRALKRLEERLGGELFVRHALGADLTAYGEAFLAHARILQADADRTVADLTLLKGASKASRVSASCLARPSFIMPPAFESALRLSPTFNPYRRGIEHPIGRRSGVRQYRLRDRQSARGTAQ